MNFFINRVVTFLAIPTLLFILFFSGMGYLNKKKLNDYRVNKNKNILFIGDSHVQMTINDSLLPNAVNVSQNSESYKFSYFKLDNLLKNNKNIQKVYLGYGYHSLSNYNDDYISGIYSKDISARYFFLLPFKEQCQTVMDNRNELAIYLRNIIELGWQNAKQTQQYSFLGFFENTFQNASIQDSSMNKRIRSQYYEPNGSVRGYSQTNLFYLDKIINLCRQYQVELTLINTPIHKVYKSKIPPQYMIQYYAIAKQNNLTVLEFNDLNLTDSCFIPDGDHVSAQGALLTTQYFKERSANKSIGYY